MIRKIVKKLLYTGYYLYARVRFSALYGLAHKKGRLSYLSQADFAAWKGAYLSLLKDNYRANYGLMQHRMFTAFAKADIRAERSRPAPESGSPIVVLCVKNDLARLRMLVGHYRALGVERFAILDNGSTDGTKEWLLSQEDIDVYACGEPYQSFVKEAWISRLVSVYGFHRWYVLTDSDELCVYEGMETHPLKDVAAWGEKHGVRRIRALTLDMYADGPLYSPDSPDGDIQEKYCYMDTDSYHEQDRTVSGVTIKTITGGPRERVLHVSPTLMKYPLVYFTPGMISCNAHFQYPYREIPQTPCYLGVLHYKFMGADRAEYQKRSDPRSGFSAVVSLKGAGYYSAYAKAADEPVTFMYGQSARYEGPASLRAVPMIRAMDL